MVCGSFRVFGSVSKVIFQWEKFRKLRKLFKSLPNCPIYAYVFLIAQKKTLLWFCCGFEHCWSDFGGFFMYQIIHISLGKYRFFHYFGFRGGRGVKMWVSPWKLVYISSKHYKLTFWWFCSDLVDFWNFRFFMYQNYATTQKNTYLCFGAILEGFYGGEKNRKIIKNRHRPPWNTQMSPPYP